MNLLHLWRLSVVAGMALLLGACGGSSENASPGAVVVEVPVAGGGGGGGGTGGGGDGGDDGDSSGSGSGNDDGATVATVVPPRLANIIADSGETASAAFGGRAIHTIDVGGLDGGAVDPAGVVLGNDVVFEISGGALRVTPPAGAARSSGGGLPDCQLTVAPGAAIVGATNEDFLVVQRGCALMAEGTAEQPIVLTAKAEVMDNVEGDSRGLWGGLVVNGYAPINDCPEGVAGGAADCTKEGEASSGLFGGSNPNDNSGVLRYLSVRFAGANVDQENQLNGIAFQAVGDATVVEYVQVHNNLDDGVEFFGGTVDAKYVVLTGNADDSLDWTDGWTGRIQHLYIEQTDAADNAIEADNREGDEDAEPRSSPAIANMTVRGKADERALRLRRGTGLKLRNSLVGGADRCLRVDGASRGLLGSELVVEGVSFACARMHERDEDNAVANYLAAAMNVSENGSRVDPVPIADAFFDATDHVGAFGADNWAAGWTYPRSVSMAAQAGFGCPAGTSASARRIGGKRVCQLSGVVAADLLLDASNVYELADRVTVGGGNEASATLTLQAGATVFGSTADDFLVVSRGSRIVANGARTAPVVFTSEADLEGRADLAASRGHWGGLVLNGNAPINDCPAKAAGGADPADSSGRLRYVVVKYAGALANQSETRRSGIAFRGVGAGTDMNYVQVHGSGGDGVGFCGGTTGARHVVLTGSADRSLYWTGGWQGAIEHLATDQAPAAGDDGGEANNGGYDAAAVPRPLPKIANATIGAVAEEDWTLGWTVAMPRAEADSGCPQGTTEIDPVGGRRTCELAGAITGEVALSRSHYYVLGGKVIVGEDIGDSQTAGVLRIESGTTIMGDDPGDFLVVSRGSRIEANGTRSAPITLTAVADVLGDIADPPNTQGLWGGLVINGFAPIDDCPEGAAGGTVDCVKEGAANSGLFGGADAEDSSGRLRYVVVKFAGASANQENERSGIAFRGVGSGTEVDYVQAYNSADDGVAFFGGAVNASHLALVGNADDSLDWTDGWTGSIQYLHIEQTAAAGDNMIEADNRDGDEQAVPIPAPSIANATMVGSAARAIRLRRGVGLRLYNSEVDGSTTCLRVQGRSANLLDTRIEFQGVGFGCEALDEGDDGAAASAFLGTAYITQDGSRPNPEPLPSGFDSAGDTSLGSDVANWGGDWTVGLD